MCFENNIFKNIPATQAVYWQFLNLFVALYLHMHLIEFLILTTFKKHAAAKFNFFAGATKICFLLNKCIKRKIQTREHLFHC